MWCVLCIVGVFVIMVWYGVAVVMLAVEQRPGFSEKAQVCTWRKEGRKERKEKEAGLIKRLLGNVTYLNWW